MLAAGAPFYLATGRFEAADDEACRAYLEFLGSRLVFLIDWNRARKQLRRFPARAGSPGAAALGGGDRDRASRLPGTRRRAAGQSGDRGDRRIVDAFRRPAVRRAGRCGDAGFPALRLPEPRPRGCCPAQSHALIHDRIRVTLATHFSNEERQLLHLRGGSCRADLRTRQPGARRRAGGCGAARQARQARPRVRA